MATSGTVNATPIDVATIVDHAVRRTGKLVSTLSGELLISIRQNLFLLLSDLSTRGLSLWCLQKQVLSVVPGVRVYNLPAGTMDLLKMLYRTTTVAVGTLLLGPGYQGADLALTTKVDSVSLQFTVAVNTKTLAVESSDDGVLWTIRQTWALIAGAGDISYLDLDFAPAARYWRVRDTTGTLAPLQAVAFHTLPVELHMTAMNRDDYLGISNKDYPSKRLVQYWYNKQLIPNFAVWPIGTDCNDQIVVWVQRRIQDPGAMNGTLDVPAHWLNYVIYGLSVHVAEELPAAELPPGRLEYLVSKAAMALTEAENGESDGAPIRIQPNIRGYSA